MHSPPEYIDHLDRMTVVVSPHIVCMQKLEKGFAIGAVLTAIVVGGVFYAVYPNGFDTSYSANKQSSGSTTTATLATPQAQTTTGGTSSDGTVPASSAQNFSNTSQNAAVPSGTSSAQPSSNGY